MSNNDDWKCSVDGCTRQDPYCLKRIKQAPRDGEEFNFIKVPGTDIHLCSWMVNLANTQVQLLEADEDEEAEESTGPLDARTIYDGLCKRVHGQEPAMKTLATMIWEELYVKPELRKDSSLLDELRLKYEDIRKNNGIIVGPTGSGKTYMLQVASQMLGIPFYLYRNTADLTEAGYVGSDVDEIIAHAVLHTKNWLRQHGEGDLELETIVERINNGEQRLMIGLDEFDKLAKPDSDKQIGRDVSGGGVQNALLTLLEGQEVAVNFGNRMQPEVLMVDTTFIAFIAVGAFSDGPNGPVEGFISASLGSSNDIERSGSATQGDDEDLYLKVQKEHLKKFGFNSQILGRLSNIIRLRRLGEPDLVTIMKEMVGNPLDRYRAQYRKRGFELEFDDDAIELIARRASEKGTGARGLDEVMTDTFRDVSFEAESRRAEGANTIHISEPLVRLRGKIFEEDNEDGVPPTFRQTERLELETSTAVVGPSDDVADDDVADDDADAADPDNDE
mgnify:CR=1 FL=1